ncbi:MAG: SAM-dependent methyltransferase [Dehalococcoidia bacterium]|nr:SAM-dependent methyltransferase [Dehalococcoidia bacterium]
MMGSNKRSGGDLTRRVLTRLLSRPLMRGKLDTAYRLAVGKSHLPPWHLRYYVGPPADFEAIGVEFMAYMKALFHLKPEDRVIDIGCGSGMIAMQLADYLITPGQYTGMDISGEAIAWCQKNISPEQARFQCIHSDVRNTHYNPTGRIEVDQYSFPLPTSSADFVLLKSVFTHMLPGGLEHYLDEIHRLMADEGRALLTFFLIPGTAEERAHLMRKPAYDFRFGNDEVRFVKEDDPEYVTAYSEAYVRALLAQHDLTVRKPIHYGTWSGRRGGLQFQDLVLVTKTQ